MSRFNANNAGGVTVTIKGVGEIAATLMGVEPAMASALAERNIDFLSHARRRTIKKSASWFARGRARRFTAHETKRYGRTVEHPIRIKDAKGEEFSLSPTMRLLEEGGRVGAMMALPIDALKVNSPAGRARARATFKELLASGRLQVVGKRGLLVDRGDTGYTARQLGWAGKRGKGSHDRIVGILVRGRTQPKMLSFYRSADEVWREKHEAKYDRVAGLALTEAGRSRLARERAAREAGRGAFLEARSGALARGLTQREAKEIAVAASRAARKEASRGE